MNHLEVISTICERFNVTSRTLRYYEEIGLIKSIRQGDGNYRYYDDNTIKRIEHIILMRRLSLSVKEIQKILSTKDIEEVMTIFVNKLSLLKEDLMDKVITIKNIEDMLGLIKQNRYKFQNQLAILNDALKVDDTTSEKDIADILDSNELLNEWNIRIIKLHPMLVAYYIAYGKEPENETWEVLFNWVKENQLDQMFTTRYFGFNNPDPSKDNDEYGYEGWVTLKEKVKPSAKIKMKTFKGGLYAVMTSNVFDIVASWQKLYKIVNQSNKYIIGKRWLEEHIILGDITWEHNFQVDLYCPLELKKEEGNGKY